MLSASSGNLFKCHDEVLYYLQSLIPPKRFDNFPPITGGCSEGLGALTVYAGRPGSSEVPRNPLTRWDVSSIPANGIFLTKKIKNKNKNAQRVEND